MGLDKGNIRASKMFQFNQPLISARIQAGSTVLSSDLTDDEATAAAGIMLRILGGKLLNKTGSEIYASVDVESLCNVDSLCRETIQARAVVVMLSSGSLESVLQLRVIGTVMQQRCCGEFPVAVPVHLPGFQFPSEHYFRDVLPHVWPTCNDEMRSHV